MDALRVVPAEVDLEEWLFDSSAGPVPRADIPAGIVLSREADAWIREDEVEDVALPLYEGRMIGQFDFSQKGWASGKGRGAVWREIPWERKVIEPQYLMAYGPIDRVARHTGQRSLGPISGRGGVRGVPFGAGIAECLGAHGVHPRGRRAW